VQDNVRIRGKFRIRVLEYRNSFLLSLCATTCSATDCFRLNSKSLICDLFSKSSYCRHASRLLLLVRVTVRFRLGLGKGLGFVKGLGLRLG
jgi:hypothetical protein